MKHQKVATVADSLTTIPILLRYVIFNKKKVHFFFLTMRSSKSDGLSSKSSSLTSNVTFYCECWIHLVWLILLTFCGLVSLCGLSFFAFNLLSRSFWSLRIRFTFSYTFGSQRAKVFNSNVTFFSFFFCFSFSLSLALGATTFVFSSFEIVRL